MVKFRSLPIISKAVKIVPSKLEGEGGLMRVLALWGQKIIESLKLNS